MADPERSALRDVIRLLGFVRPYLAVLALAIVFSWLYGGGLSGRALLLQPLVDDVALPNASLTELDELLDDQSELSAERSEEERTVLRERVRDNFYSVLVAGALLIVLMPLLRLVRDYSSYWIMQRLAVDMQQAIGEKLLRLPLAHHVREGRGEAIRIFEAEAFPVVPGPWALRRERIEAAPTTRLGWAGMEQVALDVKAV